MLLMKGCEKVRYCRKCNVNVKCKNELCPLCQSKTELINESEELSFPKINNEKSNKFVYKLVAFISAFIIAIVVIINFIFKNTGYWSAYVIAGIGSLWAVVLVAVKKRRNILKSIFFATIIIVGLSALWDLATGMHKWSTDFVLPIMITISTIAIFVLIKALKIQTEEYSVYLCNLLLLNLLLILSFAFVAVIKLPTVICIGIDFIITAMLAIFDGGNIIDDVKRRLHI